MTEITNTSKLDTYAAEVTDEIHGWIVTWDIWGSCPVHDIDVALHESHVPGADKYTGPISKTEAFNRARYDAAKSAMWEGQYDKIKCDDSKYIKYQYSRRVKTEYKVGYVPDGVIVFSPTTGAISCSNKDLGEQLNLNYSHHINRKNSTDITKIIQTVFDDASRRMNGKLFPMNDRKGVAYFADESYGSLCSALRNFLSRLSGYMRMVPVLKGKKQGDDSIAEIVFSGIDHEINELKKHAEEWSTSTRESTIKKAMESYRKSKLLLASYSQYLGDKQAAAEEAMEQAKEYLFDRAVEIKASQTD